MKHHNCTIYIQWVDHEQRKQVYKVTFHEPITQKDLYRGIKQLVKDTFNIDVGKAWIRENVLIASLTDKDLRRISHRKLRKAMEKTREVNDSTATSLQEEVA